MIMISKKQLQGFLLAEVAYLALEKIRPVTMSEVLDAVAPHRSAKFIQNEIPRRYARRIRQIEQLDGWERVPELVKVREVLFNSFQGLRMVRRGKEVGLAEFTQCLHDIRKATQHNVNLVAAGMQHVYKTSPGKYSQAQIDGWLDEFFLSRIGTQMLITQYIACEEQLTKGKVKATGIVDEQCDATKVCRMAVQQVRQICQAEHRKMPRCVIQTYTPNDIEPNPGSPCTFPFIPTYLFYILQELLKNSFRATVEKCKDDAQLERHSIRVIVSCDEKRVAIRVSDRAGGIPFDVGEKVWSYLYSTAPKKSNLAGYGVGLPISRLYAQYLGGSLRLATMPGYGTDAYLLLPKISDGQVENLPQNDVS